MAILAIILYVYLFIYIYNYLYLPDDDKRDSDFNLFLTVFLSAYIYKIK